MPSYQMANDFIDLDAERSLLAAVTREPSVYWQLLDLLPPGVFTKWATAWEKIAAAIESEQKIPKVAKDFEPATDPEATARRLADLYQRRLMATALERFATGLFESKQTAMDLAASMQEEA